MNFDYKLIIGLAALFLSIYNFFYSRRLSILEKKTQVMAEVGEVQMVFSEIYFIYQEITLLIQSQFIVSSKSYISLIECRDNLEKAIEEVSSTFHKMHCDNAKSSEEYENMRPTLQKIIRDGNFIIENAKNLKLKAESLSEDE